MISRVRYNLLKVSETKLVKFFYYVRSRFSCSQVLPLLPRPNRYIVKTFKSLLGYHIIFI